MIFRNTEIDYCIREKKVCIILAVSLSLLIILSFYNKVILSVDKSLPKRNGVTIFQKFFSSVMLFSLRFLYQLFFILLNKETIILLLRILFSIFIGSVSQKIVTEFSSMHYYLGQFPIHKNKVITTNVLLFKWCMLFLGFLLIYEIT